MTGNQSFTLLAPIKGSLKSPFGRVHGPGWQVELEPGLLWRTREEQDWELFDRFWDHFHEGISQWERRELRSADTWLAGQASDLEEIAVQVGSFVVATSLHGRVSVLIRSMIFEHDADDLKPEQLTTLISTSHLAPWPANVTVDEESRRRVRKTFESVRRAFAAPTKHAFLRAIGRFRGAVFSRFVETTAIMLCASLEALGKFDKSEGRPDVKRRLLPNYARDENEADAVLEGLYGLRNTAAHGGEHTLKTVEEREEALDRGIIVAQKIIRRALADPDLFAAANQGHEAMKDYLEG